MSGPGKPLHLSSQLQLWACYPRADILCVRRRPAWRSVEISVSDVHQNARDQSLESRNERVKDELLCARAEDPIAWIDRQR